MGKYDLRTTLEQMREFATAVLELPSRMLNPGVDRAPPSSERAADEAYWRPLLAEQAEMRAALRRGELSLGWP